MNLVELAKSKGVLICTAESLTAGLVSAEIAKTPGASGILAGGLVVYQDSTKSQLLGVSAGLIESQSAIDPEVAAQMATSAQVRFSRAAGIESNRMLAIATTGVAGPGSVRGKVPGTVFIAIAFGEQVAVYAEQFLGDRAAVTSSTVERCMSLIREHLEAI